MPDGTDPTPPQPGEPIVGVPTQPAQPAPSAPTPPPQPPAQPDPDNGDEDDGVDDGEDLAGREAKARREARNLRSTLKAERASRDQAVKDGVAKATADLQDQVNQLQEQVAERDAMLAGVGKFKDPRDVARYIDVAATPADKLGAEIDKVLAERPYLAATASEPPGHLPQGQQGEPSQNGQGGADWIRNALTGRR